MTRKVYLITVLNVVASCDFRVLATIVGVMRVGELAKQPVLALKASEQVEASYCKQLLVVKY